ncbi:MAG: SRPBCC family protein [Bacteroidales bacterium]|nr:SRPBCC family protein [Bacteroidales bacterium]
MVKKKSIQFIALIAILFNGFALYAKDKAPIIIKQELIIKAPIQKAWQVLGPEFADAYKWASSIKHSEARNHETINGSTCTERGCNVSGIGNIKEKILQYSETEHILSYQVYEGMPKMVKYAANTWKLSDLGNGTTKLEMQIEMKVAGFMGNMMKGMMRKKMTKLSKQITEEFQYYIENGKPHPRKLKSTNQ